MPLALSLANTIYVDIASNSQQEITIAKKDRIEFSFLDGTHTVIINNINEKGADLDFFPYINLKDKPPVSYATANYGSTVYLDVNKDLIKDIAIKLINTDENYETATFLIANINIEENINVNGSIMPSKVIKEPKEYNYNIILIILGITIAIVISLITYFVFKK